VDDDAAGVADFVDEEHAASAPTRVLASSTIPSTRARRDIQTSNMKNLGAWKLLPTQPFRAPGA
jgi:hypothetical protein